MSHRTPFAGEPHLYAYGDHDPDGAFADTYGDRGPYPRELESKGEKKRREDEEKTHVDESCSSYEFWDHPSS